MQDLYPGSNTRVIRDNLRRKKSTTNAGGYMCCLVELCRKFRCIRQRAIINLKQ